jgi:hypothetical protein
MKTAPSAVPEFRNARRSVAPANLFRFVSASLFSLAMVLVLVSLNACTSNNEKSEESKPAPKTTELLMARSAFQKLYIAARGWNADAKPYRIQSIVTSDGDGHDGKAAQWQASFASANARAVKTYTWSGSTANGAPEQGINFTPDDSYSPTNASTQVFDMAFLKIESDQAFDTAQKHGGDKILEKDPNTPVTYVCDWNHAGNDLVWHVIYGTGRDDAKLTVSVNASTGEFIRVEK